MDCCGKFAFGCFTRKCYDKSHHKNSTHSESIAVHQFMMEINGLECSISQTTNNKRPSIPEFCRRNNGNDYDTSKLIETSYDQSADGDDDVDDVDDDDNYDDDNGSNNSEEVFYGKEIDSSKDTYYVKSDKTTKNGGDSEDEGEDEEDYKTDDEGVEVKMPIQLTPKLRRLIAGLDSEALRLNELLISSGNDNG
jgi:hypothetical protein